MVTKRYELFPSFGSLCGRLGFLSYQRDIEEDRVVKIKEYVLNTNRSGKTVILGTVALGFFEERFYILDGQHRLSALEKIFSNEGEFVEIDAMIYEVETKEELKDIFYLFNKSVQALDFIRNPATDKLQLLKDINSYLTRLGRARGFNNNIKRPNVNITGFINLLEKSKLFELINSVTDFNLIFNFLNEENERFFQNPKNRNRFRVSDAMIETCQETQNFLALRNFIEFDERDLTRFEKYLQENRHGD